MRHRNTHHCKLRISTRCPFGLRNNGVILTAVWIPAENITQFWCHFIEVFSFKGRYKQRVGLDSVPRGLGEKSLTHAGWGLGLIPRNAWIPRGSKSKHFSRIISAVPCMVVSWKFNYKQDCIVSLLPTQHLLVGMPGFHEGLCTEVCIGGWGWGGHFALLSKGLLPRDTRHEENVHHIRYLNIGSWVGFFFLCLLLLAHQPWPLPAKIWSYPVKSSLNDSDALYSIKPELSPWAHNHLLNLTMTHLWSRWQFLFSVLSFFFCAGLLASQVWHTINICWI